MGMFRNRRRDERGAVLFMVATLAAVLILVGAFAVDLGAQRVGRRDMQALADLVALDMARQLDGTTKTGVLTASAAWNNQLTQSVARNSTTLGDNPTVTAVAGTVDALTGVFSPTAANVVPTAVKVSAKSSVDFSFVPGDQGSFNRTAVAQTESNACWGLGSYAAALDTDKAALLYPLLGQALSTSLNLQAIGYNGLASTNITLLNLLEVDRLNVGTTEELLATSVSVKDFYLAVADALSANGDTANAALVQNIAVHIGSVAHNVNIGELLNVSQGNTAALSTTLNVFNLLTGAAFLANGSSAVALQSLNLTLPLLGTVSGGLSLIQKPVNTCGKKGTTLHTEQATVGPLSANLSSGLLSGITIPGLTTVGVTAPTPISVSASLAGANGTLADVTCSPASMKVDVTSELAGAHLEVPLRLTGRINPLGIGLVNLVLPLTIKLDTTQSSQVHTATLTPPPFDVKTSTGSGTIGLSGATATITLDPSWTAVTLLGVNVKPLVTAVVNGLVNGQILTSLLSTVVTPVANLIDTAVLGPLQRLLGLTVAGADVFARAPAPTCDNPVLKGK